MPTRVLLVQDTGSQKRERKKPTPEHIDMVLNDPKLAKKFDAIYGKGAAKELFRRMGSSPNVRALCLRCPVTALSSGLWH